MDSQRDMVRASLEAEHDHGTYCRRKGERRQEERRESDGPKLRECGEPYGACSRFSDDPATTVTVDRERLELVERLLTEAMEDEFTDRAACGPNPMGVPSRTVRDALAELRSLLGGDGSTVRP